MFPEESDIVRSYDKIIKDAQQASFPMEFLNTFTITGLPPHLLNLKIGLPVILIRNVNPACGLCNDTRLINKSIRSRIIEDRNSGRRKKGARKILIYRLT